MSRLLRQAEAHAGLLLAQHRSALDQLTERLLADETVDGGVVYQIIRADPGRAA